MVAHVPKNIDKVSVIKVNTIVFWKPVGRIFFSQKPFFIFQFLSVTGAACKLAFAISYNFTKQEKMIENLPVPSQNNWADTSLH